MNGSASPVLIENLPPSFIVNGNKGLSVNDFYSGLESSGWLRHIKAVLDAAIFLAKVTVSHWFGVCHVWDEMDLALVQKFVLLRQPLLALLHLFNEVHFILKWYLIQRFTITTYLETTFYLFAFCCFNYCGHSVIAGPVFFIMYTFWCGFQLKPC